MDPQTGQSFDFVAKYDESKTLVHLPLEANQSLFVIFADHYEHDLIFSFVRTLPDTTTKFDRPWTVYFNSQSPAVFNELKSWTTAENENIKYFSGTATYHNIFTWTRNSQNPRLWLVCDSIYNIASVRVNGIECGTLWTPPYELNIGSAVKQGRNEIEIEVTNTWHNRLIGDNLLPIEKRTTWTTAPFRLKDKPLLSAGLVGRVRLIVQ
jgi:hypothetical protein